MSGFIYPVANIPIGIRWFANFVSPLLHFADSRCLAGCGLVYSLGSVLLALGLMSGFFSSWLGENCRVCKWNLDEKQIHLLDNILGSRFWAIAAKKSRRYLTIT